MQIIILNAKILKNEGQKTLIFGQLSVKTILRKTNDYSTSLKIFICVTKKYLIHVSFKHLSKTSISIIPKEGS